VNVSACGRPLRTGSPTGDQKRDGGGAATPRSEVVSGSQPLNYAKVWQPTVRGGAGFRLIALCRLGIDPWPGTCLLEQIGSDRRKAEKNPRIH
jgi:hypothetical protein